MNPIATLYHIAPCCFVFLALPFTYMELPKMVNDHNLHLDWRMAGLLLISAGAAFGEWRSRTRACVFSYTGRRRLQASPAADGQQ